MFVLNDMELIDFCDLDDTQKQTVLMWRNHAEIRKWMLNQEEIALADHLKFIDSLKCTEAKKYFMVKREGEMLGVIDFLDISRENKSCELGLYANPFLAVAGIGSQLIAASLEYAFNILKMDVIRLEVFTNNQKAQHLYKKFHFETIGESSDLIYMELKRENR